MEKLVYESQPNFHVSADLYIPKNAKPPFPGVLFQMGHTANGKAGATYQHCCQGLVQLGFLVLGFDPMGQGERIYYPKGSSATGEHSQAGRAMLLAGKTATCMQVWDAMRSLDVLAAHPMVDAKRIGATGQSGGGTTTMFLSAVDDRIAAAVVCSGITENFACANFNPPGSTDDAEQDFVGSGPLGFDRWDLLYPLAPKPLFVSVSDRDFFGTYSPSYVASGWEEFQKLRRVYEVLGRESQIGWGGTPLPHGLSYDTRLLVYNWFARWLKGESRRIEVEPPTEVEADSTLWVSPSGNTVQSFSSETPVSLTVHPAQDADAGGPENALKSRDAPARSGGPGSQARPRRALPDRGHRNPFRAAGMAARLALPAQERHTRQIRPAANRAPAGRNSGWQEGGLYQALAGEGHIVCAPDLRGVGDMKPEMSRGAALAAERHNSEESWAWASMILGKPLVGQRVTDILAMQEALRHHDGVAGHPFIVAARGEMTVPAQLAAALDADFSALYLSGGLISFRNILETEYYTHPFGNFLPGVLRHTDLTELPGPKRVIMAGTVNAAGQPVPTESVKRPIRSCRILK